MSGRKARASRQRAAQVLAGAGLQAATADGFRAGLPGPAGYVLRAATAADADAIQQLIPLAGVDAEPELISAIRTGQTGLVPLAAMDDSEAGLSLLAEHLAAGTIDNASVLALVACRPEHPEPVGVCLTLPPGQVLSTMPSLQAQMLVYLAISKISVLAVDPDHRRNGLGRALLLQATWTAHRAGAQVVYGQAGAADHQLLEWYRRQGFTLLPPGDGIDLQWLFQRPVGINTEPTYQLFQSTFNKQARPLAAGIPAASRR